MSNYDNDNDHSKMWAAAVWTTFWLSCLIGIFVIAVADARAGHDKSYIEQPPVRYAYTPSSYAVRVITLKELRILCLDTTAVGCSLLYENKACMIILPVDYDPHLFDQIVTHEYGHCNGWPAHHPDARIK